MLSVMALDQAGIHIADSTPHSALLVGEAGVHIWNPTQSEARELPHGIPAINLPDIRGCVPGGAGLKYYYLNFLLQVIFDAVAFVFALIPFYRDRSKITRAGEIWRILLRDSIGYFALCLCANLANIVSLTAASRDLLISAYKF